jgi:TetR/AcrR family fatty acid metabolism transcriptional regulator
MRRVEEINVDLKTKELILIAAEELFALNGFTETRISSISEIVGISDATVYEHYESKEELLFSIPRTRTLQLIEANEQDLRGLKGAQIKLRKLVWNYMELLANDPAYASLLLFELRRKRRFYETGSYELIRSFTRPYREAIIEGKNYGEFWPTLSPSLVLNLIFGTIDNLMITWLIRKNPPSLLDQFEDFFDLVLNAIVVKKAEPVALDKKTIILNAAMTAFAEFGYDKARIQDIAKLAGVGEGTIYEYFKNKNEILFTLPVEKTKELIAISMEHLDGIKDPPRKLATLIKDYLDYLAANKDYSKIVIFDLRYNRDFYRTKSYDLFREFALIFHRVILEGVNQQIFRKRAHPFLATKMIFGVIDHSMLSWIHFSRPRNLLSLSDAICDLILKSLRNQL